MRHAVCALSDPIAGRITLSIGLSVAAPEQVNEDVAVREAEDALYQAKRDGRNRVQTASEALERFESDATPTRQQVAD